MAGRLFVVATPIGNMEDVTLRALRTLRESDLVAAEDTRTTRKLLDRYDIRVPLVSFFEHNEIRRVAWILDQLREGKNIALVSEAGTPAISDPGFVLVRDAIAAGIKVVSIPGACAAAAAISVSGLPTDSFFFEGYLPRRTIKRRRRLEELRNLDATLIFYESPHRLVESLQDMLEVLGDRRAAVAHELTKIHEDMTRGTLSAILAAWRERPVKGEFTIVMAGRTRFVRPRK
jgi:16S rRNA (cytidine1402-2'-O)-methyltransferase